MKRISRIIAVAMVLCTLLTLLPAVSLADTLYGVTTKRCNFRTGPSTDSELVSGCHRIPTGSTVTILDNTSNRDYWKVQYKTYTGWIYGDYVKLSAAPAQTGSSTTTTTTTTGSGIFGGGSSQTTTGSGLFGGSSSQTTTGSGIFGGSSTGTASGTQTETSALTGVTTKKCNFRTGSSTSSEAVSGCSSIPSGKTVTILDNTTGGKYMKVQYGNYTGWIYASYVKVSASSSVTTPTTGTTGTTGATGSGIFGGGSSQTTTGSGLFGGGSTTQTTTGSGLFGGGSSSGSSSYGSSSNGELSYANYTGTSSDIWGSIKVAGTGINEYIYCNAINSKGQFYYNSYSSSYNYIYALSYATNPIAVIYGHNMRKAAKSKTTGLGLHDLHHVQNAWLGISKCEYCGRSCSGAKTGTFEISYNGSTQWQLVGFFELSSATMSSSSSRKAAELMASMQSNRTGSYKQQWIDYMMSYCKSSYKGATLGSMSANDKVMVIVTCADKSGNNSQRMYMLLKAVN